MAVTPLDDRYGGRTGLDTDDHTARLLDMFEDAAANTGSGDYPGGDFFIPPNPVAGEWRFKFDSPDYRPIKLRSRSRCLMARLPNGDFNPQAKIHRLGQVPHGAIMFTNSDQRLGNSDIRLSVFVYGDKQNACVSHGGTYSVDRVAYFCRINQDPRLTDKVFYNNNINVSGCRVTYWPGFTFHFTNTRNLRVEHCVSEWSHRDACTLYMAHIHPVIRWNRFTDCGDDCIALRQDETFVQRIYGNWIAPPITNPFIAYNVLSEKRRMDLPQPAGDRVRSANCGINLVGRVQGARLNQNRVLYTYDGGDPGTIPRPAINLDVERGKLFPTDVRIQDLSIVHTRAPGVWVRDPRITGGISRGNIAHWIPFRKVAPWTCPWILAPHFGAKDLHPTNTCTT